MLISKISIQFHQIENSNTNTKFLNMSRLNKSLKSDDCWIPGILSVFKLITLLCCVVGFVLNSLLIFQHFIESKTVTTSNLERKSKLRLPSLTICSPYGFKEKIFTVDGITHENYINNTIELKEIVNSIYIMGLDYSLRYILNIEDHFNGVDYQSNAWKIGTIYSKYRGRCYTIQHEVPVNVERSIF